jgi:hypothetical protein
MSHWSFIVIRNVITLLFAPIFTLAVCAQPPSDCVRGRPQPILSVGRDRPQATFTAKSDTEAIEKWQFDSKTSITISQYGCSQYVEKYVFSVEGDNASSTNRAYWLHRSAELLSALPVAESKRRQIQRMADLLNRSTSKSARLIGQLQLQISESEHLSILVRDLKARKEISIEYIVDI